MGWIGSSETNGAWSKGALTTVLCQFLEFFCSLHGLETAADERIRLVVPCPGVLIVSLSLVRSYKTRGLMGDHLGDFFSII